MCVFQVPGQNISKLVKIHSVLQHLQYTHILDHLGPSPARKWYRHSQWDPLDRLRPQETWVCLAEGAAPCIPTIEAAGIFWAWMSLDHSMLQDNLHDNARNTEIPRWRMKPSRMHKGDLILCPAAVSKARSPSGLSKILGAPSCFHGTMASNAPGPCRIPSCWYGPPKRKMIIYCIGCIDATLNQGLWEMLKYYIPGRDHEFAKPAEVQMGWTGKSWRPFKIFKDVWSQALDQGSSRILDVTSAHHRPAVAESSIAASITYAPVDQHGYAKPAICWECSKQNPWDSISKHMNLPESTRGAHFQKITPWNAPLSISLCWVASPPTSGVGITNGPWIAHASSASIIMSSTHGCCWSAVEASLGRTNPSLFDIGFLD